jgi:hypothetical protein
MTNSAFDQSAFEKLAELPALPSPEDKLFTTANDWHNNACLNWCHDGWSLYARGYKEAADILVERIEERNAGQDTLVYPIIFLYRQYLELEIKDTLRMARYLQGASDDLPTHHRIADLWNELHRHLTAISPGDSVRELKEVARLIGEFSKIDPGSMAFRYPVDKTGSPSLRGITEINLRNVRDVIAKISLILSCANTHVHECLQFKLEQEREFMDWQY